LFDYKKGGTCSELHILPIDGQFTSKKFYGFPDVKHRTVDYDVEEVEPGRWRWIIYSPGRTIQGPPKFRTREQAVAACMEEINNGIERTRRRFR
jgi:hypothetical protein